MKANPHNLSDTELELLEALDTGNSIHFLTSTDSEVKHSFLKAFLYEQTKKGKTFVLRVDNKKLVEDYLHDIGLHKYMLSLRKDTQITGSQLLKPAKVEQSYQIEAVKANYLYKNNRERLGEIQERYNEPIFGTFPRLKLSELYYLSKKREGGDKLDLDISSRNYLYNQNEFWYLRNKIEKAAKYYKSAFSFLRSSDEFSADVYKEFHLAENQEVVFKYLQKFISDAREISNGYRKVFEQIRQQLLTKYTQHAVRLNKLNQELEIQIEYYKIESTLTPAKKGFGAKDVLEKQKLELRSLYSVVQSELGSIKLFKINPPENSWQPKVVDLSKFCIDLKNLIANQHLIIQNRVDEQLEILNANNYNAPELAELSRNQSDLIFSINGSKLFRNEIHNMSISAWKNYDFLKELTKKILQNRLFLEINSGYAVYRSFEFTLESKVIDIIHAFENVKNSEWVERFETWYFEALFNKYSIPELEDVWNEFAAFQSIKDAASTFHSHQLSTAFQNTHKTKGELTKKLRTEGSDWKSLLISNKHEFKSYFPILVCDEEFFSSEVANFPYDYLVCIDNEDIPKSIFANSQFQSIVCLHSKAISVDVRNSANASKNYSSKKHLKLRSEQISVEADLLDHLPGKISFAKSLTRILGLATYEKHFYSAKDFSIITCLSPFCAKLLELELLDVRIKSLKYTHLESGIVEDVILKDDKSKYFVIQDGFLDPSLNLEWQISVLKNMEVAGMKVLIINTQQLARNNAEGILNLIEIPEVKSMSAYSVSK